MSKWGLYLPVHPILQVKVPFYNQFLLNFYDAAPPQRFLRQPLPATGLFWARLSALDTPTCVFPTHLWTF